MTRKSSRGITDLKVFFAEMGALLNKCDILNKIEHCMGDFVVLLTKSRQSIERPKVFPTVLSLIDASVMYRKPNK